MSLTTICLLSVVMVTAIAAFSININHHDLHFKPQESKDYRLSFAPYRQTFEEFKQEFGIQYQSAEEERYRLSVFINNVKSMEEHNLHYHQGNSTHYLGINQFADKTIDEYLKDNNMGQLPDSKIPPLPNPCVPFKYRPHTPPDHVDWRYYNKVTKVKKQKNCASGWAMGFTGAVESSWAILTGQLLELSVQQVIDCCHLFGCHGCQGGQGNSAYEYLSLSRGIMPNSLYPYIGAESQNCLYNASLIVVQIGRCYSITPGDEESLKHALLLGPVYVAVDGSDLIHYSGGIFGSCGSSTKTNHGMLVIGYGSENGVDYWIIKNSFGTSWGEQGYLRLARNQNNQCNVASAAAFPITYYDPLHR